jgi:hypothetical protein
MHCFKANIEKIRLMSEEKPSLKWQIFSLHGTRAKKAILAVVCTGRKLKQTKTECVYHWLALEYSPYKHKFMIKFRCNYDTSKSFRK